MRSLLWCLYGSLRYHRRHPTPWARCPRRYSRTPALWRQSRQSRQKLRALIRFPLTSHRKHSVWISRVNLDVKVSLSSRLNLVLGVRNAICLSLLSEKRLGSLFILWNVMSKMSRDVMSLWTEVTDQCR